MADADCTNIEMKECTALLNEHSEHEKDEIVDDDTRSEQESDGESEKEIENEIAAYSKQISQNPYVYDNHIKKIKLLRELGDLHRLREAREEMSRHFPLTEELWLDWLRDEIPLVSDETERQKIEQLFQKAFEDYQSVPVWLEYVQFAIGRMSEKDGLAIVREAFERALTTVGLHVSQGSNIWEAYREFENALLAGLVPSAGTVVTKEEEESFAVQNQRVINLFKRHLAVPLLHMKRTMDEYKEWLGQDTVDQDTQDSFNRALEVLENVQFLEDKLLTTETPHLEVYQEYIEHEMKTNDPSRIICIFERAIKDNCLNPSLWLQYTTYLDKLKVKQQISSAYERAIRNCPWSSQLWVNYILAMERQNKEFVFMKDLADKALLVGFTNAADYLAVWCQYCDYLRRRLDFLKDDTEPLETFRLTVERASDFLFENFGKDGDPEAVLQQLIAFVEIKYGKNQEKAREIWNQVMQAGHGATAAIWLHYYRFERMYGDSKHCRRILQKALNSVTDWPESIIQAYINFEREEGNLEQYDSAVAKCNAQMERINERRAKQAEREQTIQNKKIKKTDGKGHSIQPKTTEINECGEFSLKHNSTNKNKRKIKESPADSYAKEEPPEKKKKDNVQSESQFHGESVKHDPTKDNVTAFVSNLDFTLEEDRLKNVFEKCGEIVSIRLVRNYKGKSKGFGYIEFTDSNAVLQALKLDREFVDGRPMFVSRCEDRSVVKNTPLFKFPTQLEKNKLFIKGLPFTFSKEALEELFIKHGTIKEVRMVTYRNGSPKGIAYIEYDNEQSAAQAVLHEDGLVIGNHTISVAISNPPERKTPFSSRLPAPQTGQMNLGSGKRETTFRGKARTQISLVPRALRKPEQKISASETVHSDTVTETSAAKDAGKGPMTNDEFRNLLLKK
ncbi:squamous cell carcinoma antigen recognized by T-cells 3-like [Physella acuta]|uniref:squamous cell carcinoma antigen recognized by T-cells 3-like n=1 Tax=Physella acuta TaxID=109671 RepID=UPI0027DADBD3|nr:squamous cell carcinoma antigen recognized by T-cells 3-like [Physella acuta]